MSAMTGPRHSPSSPWHQDTQNHPLANASTPAPHLSVRDIDRPSLDPSFSPHISVPERSSPNYFAISVNNDSGNSHDVKHGFHARNDWDATSHTQSSIPSHRPQMLPQKSVYEGGQGDFVRSQFGSDNHRRMSVFHGLPWNHELQRIESSERTVTLHSASSHAPAVNSGQTVRNDGASPFVKELPNDSDNNGRRVQRLGPSQIHGLRPQDSMQQAWPQSPQSFQEPLQGPFSNNTSHHATPGSTPHMSHSLNGINFVSVERCAELLDSFQHDLILLDLRPFTHFAHANIKGSLNLCIPTTLLKRRSFDMQKLESTFTDDDAKSNFARWRQCRYIIAYDAATADPKDAGPLLNVLRKFTGEGWSGEGMILSGGFKAFSGRFPSLIQQHQQEECSHAARPFPKKPTSMPAVAPVAGGCALPESSAAMIPFFGNIRQHMDLLGGVGQMPLQFPEQLTESKRRLLPIWLREASNASDQGHGVSEKFLKLEEKELQRMKHAYSYELSADAASSKKYRIAGIEMGTKNRYNDIYPFDHSRVRLQDVPTGGCDYVNANHMKAEYSNKSYIATQAPVPDTFDDFWRVIWEQDVRLVVSLTAEVERGQVKCHPYWESGNYGPLRVNNFSQRYVYMDRPGSPQVNAPVEAESGLDQQNENASSNPCIIVRHFALSHTAFPFQPLREVTQLQYPYWPDFGTTSQPAHLLELVEQCSKVIQATSNRIFGNREAEPQGQRPVLVHCSAGCGRTGTFCAVDSVLDMLKRQRSRAQDLSANENPTDGWLCNEELDLIAKTVADFRTQRPSMVQNLSQFVLCYESVLEWVVTQMSEDDGSEDHPLKSPSAD